MDIRPIEEPLQVLWDFLVPPGALREPPEGDTIFVFGNRFPFNANRGIDLWHAGKAPYLVLTGKDEAGRDCQMANSRNVPRSWIINEIISTNTLENVRFGLQACANAGHRPKRVIASALPYHLRRGVATFQKQAPEVIVHPTSSLPSIENLKPLATPRIISRIASEVTRLRDYAIKGDVAEVEISPEVWRAVEEVQDFLGAEAGMRV